jgi:5-methylcytosine-specific restriction protein B
MIENPDTSSDSFEEKLKRQVAGESPALTQLAAEALFLHLLFPSNINNDTKRSSVQRVLSWSPHSIALPSEMAESLSGGLAHTGVAFNRFRPDQLGFLLRFVRSWKALTADEQRDALADPWRFKAVVLSVTIGPAYAQRDALFHLVFPDAFEPIVSREHKRMIVDAFREHVGESTDDIDKQILQIRGAMTSSWGEGFDFYDPRIEPRWNTRLRLWDPFITWAKRFSEQAGLESRLRQRTLRVAANLALAREAVRSADPTWLEHITKAFGGPVKSREFCKYPPRPGRSSSQSAASAGPGRS